jgi:hypothetical protein
MKPVPLSAFIPPVTGTGGRPSSIVANLYDYSGNFRNRAGSFKRPRTDDNDSEYRFDISRDFPRLTPPERQGVDVEAVAALLVGAAEAVPAIKAMIAKEGVDPDVKAISEMTLALFSVVETLWEKAVRPAAMAPLGAVASGRVAPIPLPKPDGDKRELIDALAAAERTAILFDANLGSVPIANRSKLNHALSSGIRASALALAEREGHDPAEAVRVADDALSLVADMAFLGQSSKPVNKKFNPSGDFHTLPIKLEFEDRGARIHFERTMRERCGIRASMSLPQPVRDAQKKFLESLKPSYPDQIVVVRVDTQKLRFNAFHKVDGAPEWIRCAESRGIPFNIMREVAGGSNTAAQAVVETMTVAD